MAFDQSVITEVSDPTWDRGQIHLRWTSTAPAGSWYQIYVGRKLTWWGRETFATVVVPNRRVRIDVGRVAASERATDFSASIPPSPGDRVTLAWQGGTFQDADIVGFRVYGSSAAGEAIDYDVSLAEILAYTPGVYTDGFGYGGFGEGGFGASAGSYSWTSDSLTAGLWSFGVVPFDAVGNEGTASETSTTILAPPLAPARNTAGKRLTYTYSGPALRQVTLNWLASPG